MPTVWLLASWLTAITHLAVIVCVVIGGPVALRWPKAQRVHLVVALLVGAVFALGMDCPLTVWQKALLERAGRPVYEGGFIEHYLVNPLTGGGITLGVNAVIVALWVVPTVVSYTILARRQFRVQAGDNPECQPSSEQSVAEFFEEAGVDVGTSLTGEDHRALVDAVRWARSQPVGLADSRVGGHG
jgi:hypothetical protein